MSQENKNKNSFDNVVHHAHGSVENGQKVKKMDAPGIEPGTVHKIAYLIQITMQSENHTTRPCTHDKAN